MINVFGSKVGQAEITEVSESIMKQWMGMGPKTKEFEAKMAERLQLKQFLLVDSGSNGLYMAIKLLNLPIGSEIILPSLTWVSCAQAILLAGCIPVFADVDIDSQNITVNTIKEQITDKTSAIMVVHYGGLPVDMDPIMELGYPVIEDACHAIDSKYKGRTCGSIGDVGVYSFDSVKNLAIGEGGGVVSIHDDYMERASLLRYCGIGKSGFEASTHGKERWWEYNIEEPFIKMCPSDIAAGIGLGQLTKLDELQSYRKKIWYIYQEELRKIDTIRRPENERAGDQHSYFTYFIRIPNRDAVAKYLFEQGIYTTLRYHPLHMNPLYKSSARLKNCEELNESGLNIPLHPGLTMDDVDFIIETIKGCEFLK
ncbi:MAG: DegT/DnrJ/EryC1/StrS family aminotransferase [Lachnospiraceae bacterium]|nr:DegT/DnrJ/EryC1/StrS family aminotransferase [Lachnospiraceae bacterium]